MKLFGIILSGTRFAGKTTTLLKILEENENFNHVKAYTTRQARKDDFPNQYEYVEKVEFEKNEFIIRAECNGELYGITYDDLNSVLISEKIPILTITPKSYSDYINQSNKKYTFLSFFLDADDDTLNHRAELRDSIKLNKTIIKQRNIDRNFSKYFTYNLINTKEPNTTELCDLILLLWDNRYKSGILSKPLIQKLTSFDCLLINASDSNISGASYDLCVGEEYYYKGRIKTLNKNTPFMLIEPYDYAIVTSLESVNIPLDIACRFDIKVQLFCQGVILSNGPQIDPGFKGKLFCLLFNTSNSPVVLKKGEHYATIEFHKIMEQTDCYTGKYQDKDSIIHYLPSNTLQGGVNELKKDIEKLRGESRLTQNLFFGIVSLFMAILAILLSLR